jgi:hypothetical protein
MAAEMVTVIAFLAAEGMILVPRTRSAAPDTGVFRTPQRDS